MACALISFAAQRVRISGAVAALLLLLLSEPALDAQPPLLAAVESIYAEYRHVVERQHEEAQSSLNLQAAVPHPESRPRFIDSDLEITIIYPVEIRRTPEIDDRITREVIRQVENDANLTMIASDREVTGGGAGNLFGLAIA